MPNKILRRSLRIAKSKYKWGFTTSFTVNGVFFAPRHIYGSYFELKYGWNELHREEENWPKSIGLKVSVIVNL
jgi:hypothetical protein